MKKLLTEWRKYLGETQWGGFTGGAAPLDEPIADEKPVSVDELRKMWDIYIDMGMSPEEIFKTPEFIEAGITTPEQLGENKGTIK